MLKVLGSSTNTLTDLVQEQSGMDDMKPLEQWAKQLAAEAKSEQPPWAQRKILLVWSDASWEELAEPTHRTTQRRWSWACLRMRMRCIYSRACWPTCSKGRLTPTSSCLPCNEACIYDQKKKRERVLKSTNISKVWKMSFKLNDH